MNSSNGSSVDIVWTVTRVCGFVCELCCVNARHVRRHGNEIIIRCPASGLANIIRYRPGGGSIFAQAVRHHQPQVLGLSGLLTTTMLGMEDVIEELKRQGLRDQVKVIIGGAPVSKKYAEQIGADGYGNDAAQAVKLVRSLL